MISTGQRHSQHGFRCDNSTDGNHCYRGCYESFKELSLAYFTGIFSSLQNVNISVPKSNVFKHFYRVSIMYRQDGSINHKLYFADLDYHFYQKYLTTKRSCMKTVTEYKLFKNIGQFTFFLN